VTATPGGRRGNTGRPARQRRAAGAARPGGRRLYLVEVGLFMVSNTAIEWTENVFVLTANLTLR
jgi:hypothetical protein